LNYSAIQDIAARVITNSEQILCLPVQWGEACCCCHEVYKNCEHKHLHM